MSGEQLPSGWVSACLADLAALNPGLGRCILDESHPVTFVPMASVAEGFGGIVAPAIRPYGEVKKGYTPFVSGDVIFAKITPCMENGKGGVVKGTQDDAFFGSTEFHVVRPRGGVQAAWLASYLSQESLRRAARLKMKGSAGQLRVPQEFLAELQVPLPPAAEQARIADRIDELFSDLDSGVEALRRVRRKLDRYRAAVLHAAVTGRLSARWREEHAAHSEPAADLLARILKARREHWETETLRKYEAKGKTPPKGWRGKYKEPIAPETKGPLPQGWVWATTGQCSSLIQYGTSAKCGPDQSGTPVLRMGNVTNGGALDCENLVFLPSNHAEFPALLLEPGDVLFNRTNSAELVGKSAIFDGASGSASFASYLIRVRCLPGLPPMWLVHCLVGPLGRQWARQVLHHTAGQANINGTKLAAFSIPLPPEDEQTVILEEADRQLSLIDTLEAEVDRTLRRSSRLRQSILKAAFEGKLVPQDPADEPASALLARLRNQAESGKTAGGGRRKKASAKKPPAKKAGQRSRRKATDPESLFRRTD